MTPDIPPQAITAVYDGPGGRLDLSPEDITDILEAAAPHLAAAEREHCAQVWRAVLTEHYLTGITCDHETKRDNPMCACSRVHLDWHPTVGAAVRAWIDHVSDRVTLLRKDHR